MTDYATKLKAYSEWNQKMLTEVNEQRIRFQCMENSNEGGYRYFHNFLVKCAFERQFDKVIEILGEK